MANPFDKVTKGYSAARGDAAKKPKSCPHCGHGDDVPEPNKKNAEDFAAGMGKQPDYIANIKKGLGIGS